MTYRLNIEKDFRQVERMLTDIQKKQLPFATARALTKTAKEDAKPALRAEMTQVFDRPTRFTLNSLFVKPATKRDLTAEVRLKDFAGKGTPAADYLAPQIKGGQRRHKRFEKLLIRRGYLPQYMYIMPTKSVRLNQYGNVTKGLITKILSGIGAQLDPQQNTKQGSKKKYFVARIKGANGIWERMGAKGQRVRLLFLFVRRPSYRKRFDFKGVAHKVGQRVWPKNFDESLKMALATARYT